MSRATHLWRRVRWAAGVVWSDPWCRIALMTVLVGVIGLALHYWTTVPLLAIMPRYVPPAGGSR